MHVPLCMRFVPISFGEVFPPLVMGRTQHCSTRAVAFKPSCSSCRGMHCQVKRALPHLCMWLSERASPDPTQAVPCFFVHMHPLHSEHCKTRTSLEHGTGGCFCCWGLFFALPDFAALMALLGRSGVFQTVHVPLGRHLVLTEESRCPEHRSEAVLRRVRIRDSVSLFSVVGASWCVQLSHLWHWCSEEQVLYSW